MSRQNRAARKRKQAHHDRTRRPHASAHTVDDGEPSMSDLVHAGAEVAYGPDANRRALDRLLTHVAGFDAAAVAEFDRMVGATVDGHLDSVFESGWQPAEFMHAVTRALDQNATLVAIVGVGAHARRHRAHTTAPAAWVEQLTDLRIDANGPADTRIGRLPRTVGTDDEIRVAALTVIGFIKQMTWLHPLMAPPSKWTAAAAAPKARRGVDPRMLEKIRGLLAKAESTQFAAEAEALSAKAQDLMTRYAIDSAVVDAREQRPLTEEVETRRLRIDNPYPEAKTHLLNAVAVANNARVVAHLRFGLVSVVGMPVDLDLCELLFTSLLVQASHALTEAGTSGRDKRTASFRRSFLYGFAARIGERLEVARDQAGRDASTQYGRELVPILTERAEAVDAVHDELFPDLTRKRHSISDGQGWHEGRVAAELADLTGGRERLTG